MSSSTTYDRSQQLAALKAKGGEFLGLLDSMRSEPEPLGDAVEGARVHPMAAVTFDRELDIALERAEEAIMWAEKHLAQ